MHLFLIYFICGLCFGDSKQFYFERLETLRSGAADPANNSELPPRTFVQIKDHSRPEAGDTYLQRYWVDSSSAQGKNAPVLFYLCGEATCRAPHGALLVWAKQLGAHVISLEHRYYGKSIPTPTLSTENLKYLSTDQALLDAAHFQEFAERTLNLSGKWLVIGGSYPGSLSAFYRLKFPKKVVGSLASSAPVEARSNFEEYDQHVFLTVGEACAEKMREVVRRVEATLPKPTELKSLKEKFQALELESDEDFLYLIADMGALAVQYGYRDRFCNLLLEKDPLEGYAQFTREIFKEWKMNALSMSFQGAVSENPDDYLDGFGMRAWMYQSCTEYGYWQNAYHDSSQSVRSTRLNPEYHRNVCRRLFGDSVVEDTGATNQKYYLPLLKDGSRIFITNGSEDPWMKLSVTPENGNDKNPELTLMTIRGESHCNDLRAPKPADGEPLRLAREKFLELASKWLENPPQ